MLSRKSTQNRKLKIGTSLLTWFICMMLFYINVFASLTLEENVDNTNTVITAFDMPITEISVDIGTEKTAIGLPGILTATMEDGAKTEVSVTWEEDGTYDKNTVGYYQFVADIGSYSYTGERPVVIVEVKTVAEPVEDPIDESTLEPPLLKQNPVIHDEILLENKFNVVIIHENTPQQEGFLTVDTAMEWIRDNDGGYTIVFLQDYTLTSADVEAVMTAGEKVMFTVTSTYENMQGEIFSAKLNSAAIDSWTCNSSTRFKNITIGPQMDIYGNGHKLIIDSGVVCESAGGNIYGGYKDARRTDVDVEIMSGNWNNVYYNNGMVEINIEGTAKITGSIIEPKAYLGKVEVRIDGTYGATVQSFSEATTAEYSRITIINATFEGDLQLGTTRYLNVLGKCVVKGSIIASPRNSGQISLSSTASLTSGGFDCPKSHLLLGTNSKVTCNGAAEIGTIKVWDNGAELNITKGYPMTVNGDYAYDHILKVNLVDGQAPDLFETLLIFTNKANANKNDYAYPRTNGYDGIITVNGNVVYTDFVPPEGYVYDWFGTTMIEVGGHDPSLNVNDLKYQFGLDASTEKQPVNLWSGQLTAKIDGYMNGEAFENYATGERPTFGYSIKVESNLYVLTSGKKGQPGNPVFRGYNKSADGSTLDLVFYLGRDVGIVYRHLTIKPQSTEMSESWDYINLSSEEQHIIVSHAGDLAYAGDKASYSISSPKKDIAYAFHNSLDPAMYMWVDQSTTANPAVVGESVAVSNAVISGELFSNSIPRTKITGEAEDNGMGTQWQDEVAAGAKQNGSGGTGFGALPTNRVTVSKTAVGGPKDQTFAFTLSVKDKDGVALAEGTKLSCMGSTIAGSLVTAPTTTELILDANGQAKFNLKNEQTLEIAGIPFDSKIQVAATEVAGYETAHTVNGQASTAVNQKDTGTLDVNAEDKMIAFKNTFFVSLTVSKIVEGEFGDKTKAFSFRIFVKDKDGGNVTEVFPYDVGSLSGSSGETTAENGELSISNGIGTFTLKHGQKITLKRLDPAYKVQISEVDLGDLYHTKYLKDGIEIDSREVSEFILGDQDINVDFKNIRDSIPITGISFGGCDWIAALGIVFILAVLFGFVTDRRRKEG